jgi:hypothetical protein
MPIPKPACGTDRHLEVDIGRATALVLEPIVTEVQVEHQPTLCQAVELAPRTNIPVLHLRLAERVVVTVDKRKRGGVRLNHLDRVESRQVLDPVNTVLGQRIQSEGRGTSKLEPPCTLS